MTSAIRHATRADLGDVAETLAEGFAEDPIMSWVYADRTRREADLLAFFGVVLRGAFNRGHVYLHPGGAAAIWSPPDVSVFDRVTAGRLSDLMAGQFVDEARLAFVEEGLAGMTAGHPEGPPHFFLFMLGTRRATRGRGLGSALLSHMLERCDAQGFPAFLEASSERNRPLYRRFGFEVTEPFSLPDGPEAWRMWRDPRPEGGAPGHAGR